MSKAKKLYILLAVLAVICMAAVIVSTSEKKQEKVRSEGITALSLDTDSVTALSWEYANNSFAFHKSDDGTWYYDTDAAFPVDQNEIETLLSVFSDFRTDFTIEDVTDLGQYGLEKPTATIRLEAGETAYDISLGDESKMDAQRYVSIGDGNVYLAAVDPLESYNVLLAGLIQNDEIPDFGSVTSLRFSGDISYTVTYEEDSGKSYDADDVYFTTLSGTALPLDSSRVSSYLYTLRYLDLTDFVTYTASEETLDTYGLDDPELTVAVSYTTTDESGAETAQTFTLALSRDPSQRDTEADEDDPDSITAYARVGDSAIVYQISGSDYLSLMECSKDNLRHQSLLWAAFTDITQVDVRLDGKDYTFTVKTEDDEHVWYYGEEKLSISDFQSALTGLSVSSFTSDRSDGKEEIRLTVHLDSEDFPTVELALYRHDGALCLATVDGVSTAYVARSATMKLVEAVNAIVLQ